MFRPYRVINRTSLWTISLKSCVHSWDPNQCLQIRKRYANIKVAHTHTHTHTHTYPASQVTHWTYFVFVNIDWDPKNVRRFLMKWFTMKLWWLPGRVETCSQILITEIGVFEGESILLFQVFLLNTSGWLLSRQNLLKLESNSGHLTRKFV